MLGHLWNTTDYAFLWGVGGDYFDDKTVSLFRDYISDFDQKLWNVNDYSFFRIFYSIKKIGEIQERLIALIHNFWSKNNIELLCVQHTEFESFSL